MAPTKLVRVKQDEEGDNGWHDFPAKLVRVRPGNKKPYWEVKLILTNDVEKRCVANFVTFFNDMEDAPRRRERRYPLDS